MPMKPDTVILDSLLAACRNNKNTNLGQKIAERLFRMGTKKSGAYVLLSNIYASQGMWEEVGNIRSTMLKRGVNKELGFIKGKLHSFLAGNKRMMEEQFTEDCLKYVLSSMFEISGCS
ncbi:unnamed protein product [Cuscuta epithymum]|uniref:Pentatricopeptide repeat-containing protein n=1 Tax=Cuscuta epithymum TaxID=186058 RepID=A0AAV0GHR3_9ASTE|nr:unnamed protein product [Cuscuta epithymum]